VFTIGHGEQAKEPIGVGGRPARSNPTTCAFMGTLTLSRGAMGGLKEGGAGAENRRVRGGSEYTSKCRDDLVARRAVAR